MMSEAQAAQVLDALPFALREGELMTRAGVDPAGEDAPAFQELLAAARAVGRPKAMYREAYVDLVDGQTVRVDGVQFTSAMLRKNLDGVGRVFPYVATCGRELEDANPHAGDLLADYWWDGIKAELLAAAIRGLGTALQERHRLGKSASMSPGSGDATVWPIEQQRALFALLGDAEARIGVTLTDSYLMVPNKTVSGIRFPSDADYQGCQVCRREVCENRRAAFDSALWDAIQHGFAVEEG